MINAIQRELSILNSHAFSKLEDKTQIMMPKNTNSPIYKNRQTHSIEVAALCKIIAMSINFDKVFETNNVGLLHDIGHSPFGHDGQKILDQRMKEYGLKEGFDDNNNNFVTIKHNNIELSDYELVSIIKRPKKLYKSQKKELLPILKDILKNEEKKYGKKQTTMANVIMDRADEIAYGLSDFVDGYNLDYTKDKINGFISNLIELAEDIKTKDILHQVQINFLTKNSIGTFRSLMTELKQHFSTEAFYLDGKILLSSNNLMILNKIISFNMVEFIKNPLIVEKREQDLKIFDNYISFIVENKYFTSKKYAAKYAKLLESKNYSKENELRIFRDMIADSGDNFVLNFMKNRK